VVGSRLQALREAPAGEPGGEPRVNAKILVTAGFVLIAAGLAVGGFTSVHSSTGHAATWFAVIGLGLGVSMPAAMNAALSALSAERSGSGSAVITAMRQVGATIGVAVLGTVITSVYRGGLDLAALPGQAADAVRTSVQAAWP
jgi:MFS transporter, DHA2 family, multidrug resistance protein